MEFRTIPTRRAALSITIISVLLAFTAAGILGLLLATFITFDRSRWYALVVGEGIIIVPSILYVLSRGYDFKKIFRLNIVPAKLLYISALLSLSIQPLADELDVLLKKVIPLPDSINEFMEKALEALNVDTLEAAILITIGAVFFAAFAEEGLFRGLLQRSFEEETTPRRAILISSFVFAVVHVSPQILQIFALGVLLGWMVYRTNSIYPAIILHTLTNGSAVIFMNFGFADNNELKLGDHVTPLILIPAMLIFIVSLKLFHSWSEGLSSDNEIKQTDVSSV